MVRAGLRGGKELGLWAPLPAWDMAPKLQGRRGTSLMAAAPLAHPPLHPRSHTARTSLAAAPLQPPSSGFRPTPTPTTHMRTHSKHPTPPPACPPAAPPTPRHPLAVAPGLLLPGLWAHGQIRECGQLLLRLAKGLNIAIFIIGHVTKAGDMAGPNTLAHMVGPGGLGEAGAGAECPELCMRVGQRCACLLRRAPCNSAALAGHAMPR